MCEYMCTKDLFIGIEKGINLAYSRNILSIFHEYARNIPRYGVQSYTIQYAIQYMITDRKVGGGGC